jgi:hypothetical protein
MRRVPRPVNGDFRERLIDAAQLVGIELNARRAVGCP